MSANIFDKSTGSGRLSQSMRLLQEQQEKQRVGRSFGNLRRVTSGGTIVRGKPFARVRTATTTDGGIWV